MKKIIIPFIVLISLTSGCSQIQKLFLDETEGGDVFYLEANDPRVIEAKKQAQAEIDFFIEFLLNKPNDPNYYLSIKTDFVEGDLHEHMWVDVKYYNNGTFHGRLDNEPTLINRVHYRDNVSVKKEDVEDWIIWDGYQNVTRGGFLKLD